MNIIVTGGAGFIGSAVIRYLINNAEHNVINVDKLTYAGNLASLKDIERSPNYVFMQSDICDASHMDEIFETVQPDLVMHLAAESHVDRSIEGSAEFIHTNIIGTHTLLEAARKYWQKSQKEGFRFHHISTDEVYGDLEAQDPAFTETTAYAPSSPYSASKASSDHLVRAWGRTYGLPIVMSNCSNNYGHYQFPEKLIPHMILNALSGKNLPIYGSGQQVRDWLHVDDHAEALFLIATKGKLGETYNVGGESEKQNIDVVNTLCTLLEELAADRKPEGLNQFTDLITYVTDRPGHDQRYAVDITKIKTDLGWSPKHTFESGMRETVQWYLSNQEWWQAVLDGSYQLERIGTTSEPKTIHVKEAAE